jgi:hypothetical protein
MTFESIYGTSWHHPYAFWALGAPVLALLAARTLNLRVASERTTLGAVLIALQLAILCDAWLTAPRLSPLEGTALAQWVAIGFVIAGDFRFFLLLERYGRSRPFASAAAGALGWSLLVPVASLAAKRLSENGRVLFLAYELTFVVLAIALRALVVPKLAAGSRRDWIARITAFEIAQYSSWAAADVLILLGRDEGFLLRLLPNAMYYVAFVPFAWLTAPEDLRP